MTDRAFSTLVTRLQPHVPQCPRPTIIQNVREAAIHLCERTLAWRYMVPLYDLLPGVHEYAFERPTNSDVQAIFGAVVNGSPLKQLTLDDAIRLYPDWATLFSGEDAEEVWSETPGNYVGATTYNDSLFDDGSTFVLPDSIVADASTPRAIVQVSPQKYIILPLPDGEETYTMRMFVALKPTRDATDMDSEAFDDLEDAIFYRALENLLLLPQKPWSNVDLAAVYARKYLALATERKANANIGHARGTVSVRMRPWA